MGNKYVGQLQILDGASSGFNSLTVLPPNNCCEILIDNIDVVTLAESQQVASVPEPSSLSVFAATSLLIGMGSWRFKK